MKVSVALCTYNGAEFLDQQLESIAAQTFRPFELVVCDDRSTDGTTDILRSFAAKAPFAVNIHVNQNNLGSTKNFEQAISLCVGEIISLSDQDDIWAADKLARSTALFEDPTIGAVFTDAEIVDQNGRPLGYTIFEFAGFDAKVRTMISTGQAFDYLVKNNLVAGNTLSFRSVFRDLVLPFPAHDKIMIHDRWIVTLISAVAGLGYVDGCVLRYRQHSDQQVGLPRTSRAKPQAVTMSPVERRQAHRTAAASLRDMQARIMKFTGGAGTEAARALDHRIAHFETRGTLAERKVERALPILRELITRRYMHHSRGLYSALRDLTF